MTIEIAELLGRIWVKVQGTFDDAEADRLSAALPAAQLNRPVTLDFREVQCFHDSAVVRLAVDLVSSPRQRPTLLGLYDHHYRLLRYLGLSAILSASQLRGPLAPSLDDAAGAG